MITGENEPFGELNRDPTRWLDSLRALINDENIKELILQFRVDVLAKSLISCRGERAADNVCICKDTVDLR